MIKIPLSRGGFALISRADSPKILKIKWHVNALGYVQGRPRNIKKGMRKSLVYMHHIVRPTKIGFSVDHKNGNKLDNRRSNLRLCTHSQNVWNSGISSRNKSGFKGVFFRKDRGKYSASIMRNGVHIKLGCFDTAEKAYTAYRNADKKLSADFCASKVRSIKCNKIKK